MNPTSRPSTKALLSLVTLAGFAAGALLVVVAFSREPVPTTGDSDYMPVATRHSPEGAVSESNVSVSTPVLDPGATASPWAFEAATPKRPGGTGAKRPDLLSAPGG